MTNCESNLKLRAMLMGINTFIGKYFIPTVPYLSAGIYEGNTYKIVSYDGNMICVELVAANNLSTSLFIGKRYVVNCERLIDKIQYVSYQFVRYYKL